jgi:hypothetical protein
MPQAGEAIRFKLEHSKFKLHHYPDRVTSEQNDSRQKFLHVTTSTQSNYLTRVAQSQSRKITYSSSRLPVPRPYSYGIVVIPSWQFGCQPNTAHTFGQYCSDELMRWSYSMGTIDITED